MSRLRRTQLISILSFFSGILLWLAWPERGFSPIIFVGFVPLLFAEHLYSTLKLQKSGFKMFGYFFLSMMTWNSLTTWWIYNSTDVGSIVAIALNSFLMTCVLQLFYSVKKRHGVAIGFISLIIFWTSFEFLHLRWEISWPWLNLGNAFAIHPEWIQWYEYTGALGGTIWILIINIMFFQLLKSLWYKDLLLRLRKINIFLLTVCVSVLLAGPMIGSLYMYHNYREQGQPVKVAIVQPNIDPYNEKFTGTAHDQLNKILRLASTVLEPNTTLLVGPETALPDGIWEEEIERNPEIRVIRKYLETYPRLNMLMGLTTFKSYPNEADRSLTARKLKNADRYYDVYNSALMIADNLLIQLYHKTRLVPGVEKMPYPQIFGFLEDYAIKLGGTSGSLGMQEQRTNFISTDVSRIAPAICYESIYGGFMSGYMKDTAELIAVITNDGWWGNTPGYRQHMNYSRLLAVEFRKSVARSANTGISCFINQRGDVIRQTGWWTEDAISETINKNKVITFYAAHGDYLGFFAAYLSIAFMLFLLLRRMILWF
jgi:apolipoprotein N-acyltransferase